MMDTPKLLCYLCRILCANHSSKRMAQCKKHKRMYYSCIHCQHISLLHQYLYVCASCKATMCLNHFILHSHSILHYWKHNALTTVQPDTLNRQITLLALTINTYAVSVTSYNSIYFIGGKLTNDVMQYYPTTKTICIKKSMLIPKFEHSLCTYHLYIYSIGGCSEFLSLNDCQQYHIVRNEWKKIPELLTPRSNCCTFVCNRQMYAFGGWLQFSYNIISKMMEKYSFQTQRWEKIYVDNCPTMRWGVQPIVLNEGVLIAGGNSDDKVM